MIGRTVQQCVDSCNRHLLVARQFGSPAFEGRQLDVGLEHVLLRRLIDLVLVPGNFAELSHQPTGRGVHFCFSPRQIVIVKCHPGRLGQPQSGVADVAFHRVGLGRSRTAAQSPLARPGNLLRGFHHPAAAIFRAEAVVGSNQIAEHRIVERDRLRVALGCGSPCGRGCLERWIPRLDLGH